MLPRLPTRSGKKKGNLDGDDQLSIDDYSKLYDIVSGAKTPTEDEKYLADINCDGSVDVADLTELSRMMLKQATLEDIYVSKHGTDAKPFMSNTVEAEATTDGRAIAIALNNASNLVAMQADITLPEGVSIVNAAATLRARASTPAPPSWPTERYVSCCTLSTTTSSKVLRVTSLNSISTVSV